jgi:acyl-CoA reductase-like NAD-dependent aldehyde dehydrogenase
MATAVPIDSSGNETALIQKARSAQRIWAGTSVAERVAVVRRIRNAIAVSGLELCYSFSTELARTRAQSLVAEVIPLADACRFLEREAKEILAPRRLSTKSRPFWLRSVDVEVRRDPLGAVLIIGPANYPLFIPGVQILQALVAGNSVVLKPGRGGGQVANAFRAIAIQAGIPEDLFVVLDERVQSAQAAIAAGVEKIVLTGSVETGRAVYGQAAEQLIPAILELSGCDPVFILASADLSRAASAIAFGCEWNGGNTCIAPRRLFVFEGVADEFERRLWERGLRSGVKLSMTRVSNDEEALEQAAACGYALGATVFGEPKAAATLAAKVQAGVVVVNDMIVPTADPRVPFGGRGWSGFGCTRGAEGLLEFTAPKATVMQKGRRLRHLEPLPNNAEEIFGAYLAAFYRTGWRERINGCRQLLATLSRTKGRNK